MSLYIAALLSMLKSIHFEQGQALSAEAIGWSSDSVAKWLIQARYLLSI